MIFLGHTTGYWLDVLVTGIVVRGLIGGFVLSLIKSILRWIFLPTEKQVAYFLHYRLRAMKRGHISKQPEFCRDGLCKDFFTAQNI